MNKNKLATLKQEKGVSALYFNYRLVIPAFKASWQPIRREVI